MLLVMILLYHPNRQFHSQTCVALAVQILYVHMMLNESKLASYELLTSSLGIDGGPDKLASSFFYLELQP